MDRPTLPLVNKMIMVVDDNNDIREIVCRTLEIEGYNVLEASDGEDALEKIQKATPDLIISDVNMPRMNGFEFYQSLKRNQKWLTIPFIFLTSNDTRDGFQTGRALGVEDYLIKPVDNEDLVKIVNVRLLRAAELRIALIDQAYIDTVDVLANSIEERDAYTAGHVQRVAKYARQLAEALHWPPENMRLLEFGARLHDVGKIIIPDYVLNKADTLSAEEWALMKQHPQAGAKMIRKIIHLQGVLPYILYHHERWDGNGYPHGLAGRDIPIEGRLLAIADVYDALSSPRPYHPARPQNEVIQYFRLKSGKDFDPDLVGTFINIIQNPVR